MASPTATLCATPPETPKAGMVSRSPVTPQKPKTPLVTEPVPHSSGLDTSILGQLESVETKTLLDTVDALRALHVGDIVQLPQIVVVGDQSTGKSSVLEAISRVSFPAKGGLCTRFATELVLRRADFASASVKIVRAIPEAEDEEEEKPFERIGFTTEQLPEVMQEAEAKMGLDQEGAIGFSRDVLRVEVSGPDVHPLTLVDLPGFFQSEAHGQNAQGKRIVDQLAESYMKQQNSIMLAIVAANYQIANQSTLRQVKKHDPELKRTLGIVTKPDIPQPGSDDQRQAIKLASGQDPLNKMPLGWHVLRNRSEFEAQNEGQDRDSVEEDFFLKGNWSVIPHKDRGAAKLREKLSRVLRQHIQRALPGLIGDIEQNLATREQELARLGRERSKPEDLRSFLVDIAAQFERLARDAVNGHYGDDFFGDLKSEEMKLRSLVRNLNMAFAVTLQDKGSAERIAHHIGEAQNGQDGDGETEESEDEDDLSEYELRKNDDSEYYLNRYLRLYKFPEPKPVLESAMKERVEALASVNQGKEFPGSVNPDLAMDFFKAQSVPWEGIARSHLKIICDYCIRFVEQLFDHVIGQDTETFESLLRFHVDKWFDSKRTGLEDKLQELFRPYKAGYGVALEREMQVKTDSRTMKRMVRHVEGLKSSSPQQRTFAYGEISSSGLLEGLARDGLPVMSQFGAEKIIDLMMAHYEMSLRTFTENIVNLAIESCLIGELQTILTPQAVNRMSDAELERLAGESEDVKAKRTQLKQQVDVLRDGLSKCQQYKPRHMTYVPSISG